MCVLFATVLKANAAAAAALLGAAATALLRSLQKDICVGVCVCVCFVRGCARLVSVLCASCDCVFWEKNAFVFVLTQKKRSGPNTNFACDTNTTAEFVKKFRVKIFITGCFEIAIQLSVAVSGKCYARVLQGYLEFENENEE